MPEADILRTPQQYLLGEQVSSEIEYKLGRACLVHCLAAAEAIVGEGSYALSDVAEFVCSNGADTGSEFYEQGTGWRHVPLANVLRAAGFGIVLQDLRINSISYSDVCAVRSGRVRSIFERTQLKLYSEYGGEERSRWPRAFEATLNRRGVVLTSISIPLLSGDGFGGHGVLVTGYDGESIEYFDPDAYCLTRYGQVNSPTITRVSEERLFYSRPMHEHLGAMTGAVMHIFPPRGANGTEL